jgi:cobaltochelatase CobN
MHLLATTSASLEALVEPVDLAQEPADMVALSFSDSDLAGLAQAWRERRDSLPSLRLAALRDLRHPMGVDLWIDRTAHRARAVVVRLLGGYDWWPYGCDRLAQLARARGIALALLPGECRERDERLLALSTVAPETYDRLLACFRHGGRANLALALEHAAAATGLAATPGREAEPVPLAGCYLPGRGIVSAEAMRAEVAGRPAVGLVFYRSMMLAEDCAPVDALCAALAYRQIAAVPIFVPSLREADAQRVITEAAAAMPLAALVTMTAFATEAGANGETLFERLGLPVLQAAMATTRREAWQSGQRGLTPSDLAMHVVLPELDGRVMAGVVSFKDERETDEVLSISLQGNSPEPDQVEAVADKVAAWLRLAATPRGERRIAIVIPDYPAATGRAGYAVGLDVPQSVLGVLSDLADASYRVEDVPASGRELMRELEVASPALALGDLKAALGRLPAEACEALAATWGDAANEATDGRFHFRHATYGNVTVVLAPDRGRAADRRGDYHHPTLPPRYALVAFGEWLRAKLGCHALVHMGAHGTLEWLPGKTVALSVGCFPEIVTGALPVVYPFIVSNPGEAAQAKRRIAAVTIGHLTPPIVGAGLSDDQRELEQLVDEFAQADGLDRRRRDRLARLILDKARATGLASEAGASAEDPEQALAAIDAWLCDLKEFAIKDGLHVFGREAEGEAGPARRLSAQAERQALLDALDGRHVRPGPAGTPMRGRTDVLPTGRNLFASDPRTLPTPTAVALAKLAADEIVNTYMQEHGEPPRRLVIDLWGSASLRTGGEEIAQGLALMGCRPQWDAATGRVTGVEVLPPATMGRPRVDVSWHISGLFRDMFPTQIALIDAAVGVIAALDEDDGENPLAAARRNGEARPLRVFGSAPGTYGGGIEEMLATGAWQQREELGQAYLAAASHAFQGAEGHGVEAAGAFAARVAEADLLVHAADDASRDVLEGSADVAFMGGFSAAVAALGGKADVVVLDTSNPERPRPRSLANAVTRAVRARALNPRFLVGQMRHGHRGAAELAETVDRLIGFAETTGAIPDALIEDVHSGYLENAEIRAFLLHENPAAARAIAQRFADARRRGLWHPRRNSIDDDLAALIAEARGLERAG